MADAPGLRTRGADYTRLADQLPPVYQEDADSFGQVDAYLGLADELNHAVVAALEDLPLTDGLDATLRWPAHLPLDAGSAATMQRYLDAYDDVASWVAYTFPGSWPRDESGLARRRLFLAKSARLWRRRGTPRGFLDWFCLYFGIDAEARRPFLLEHFKVPRGTFQPGPYTATMFVPSTPAFYDHRRRVETAEFVRWYAPAHVAVRVCYVLESFFDTFTPFADPAVLPPTPTAAQVAAYQAQVVEQAGLLNELLCSVVSVVDHAGAVHLCAPGIEERIIDQLGVGKLPHLGD